MKRSTPKGRNERDRLLSLSRQLVENLSLALTVHQPADGVGGLFERVDFVDRHVDRAVLEPVEQIVRTGLIGLLGRHVVLEMRPRDEDRASLGELQQIEILNLARGVAIKDAKPSFPK